MSRIEIDGCDVANCKYYVENNGVEHHGLYQYTNMCYKLPYDNCENKPFCIHKIKERIKEPFRSVNYFAMDIMDFLGRIEMKIKYLLNKDFYNSLSEKDIPENTFYCYSGCRICGEMCPYMDYSRIAKSRYCHYVKGGIGDLLLYDSCKICGIKEFGDEDE